MKLKAVGAMAALALFAAPAAHAACEFQKVAELPVTMQGLRPLVSAKVNGHDTRFILDTGAFFSGVTDEAAAQFGMKKSTAPFGLTLRGVGGGTSIARAVEADSLDFAGGHFQKIQFLVGGRMGGGDVAGVIGQNLLGNYDMEYDLANGVVRFFSAKDCRSANLAYWSTGKALSRIDIIDANPKLVLKVQSTARINGKSVRVAFDTGSGVSFLSRPASVRAGVPISSEGVTAAGTTYGLYGRGQETFLAPFDSFAIGGEEIKNTRLRVADIQLGEPDMLIGADFFLSHRVLVSKAQGKIYFTYNGGPVFRLDRNPGAQPTTPTVADATPDAASTAAPATAPAQALTSAAEYHRRGQASVSRRDFMAAVADFTKAIELEPNDATHYHARALARLGAAQPVLAMADLGEALKRDPNDVEALMLRGRLYLASKDPDRGRADFDAALRLAPQNTALPMQIGLSYTGFGLFEPAVRQFDAWIAAHPADPRLPQVQAARCFTRAAWGRELEAALADCDAALKKDRVSRTMEARGLVLLRLGRLDEAVAQFGAALKAQPKAAGALYGRGLAQLKKGATAEGEADIAAAKGLEPRQIEQYVRWGLTPDALAKAAPAD